MKSKKQKIDLALSILGQKSWVVTQHEGNYTIKLFYDGKTIERTKYMETTRGDHLDETIREVSIEKAGGAFIKELEKELDFIALQELIDEKKIEWGWKDWTPKNKKKNEK